MYKVTCLYGGKTYTLHDPLSDELKIYNDQLDTETNKPGSFKFTVAYNHPYLDKIVGLSSDIRVYDGAEEIWRGRPIDDGEDMYRARKFICEGELAFLYDSIQPRRELHNISPTAFLTLLLNEHNTQVSGQGPIDKTFQVGTVTVIDDNNSLYRYTNRETTLDCIGEKLINRLGGHLSVRVSNGTRYIDLLADVDTVSDQPIQFGDNLMDYAKDTDYTQVATACIPLGAALEETEIAALDAYLTVASVNNGSDTIQITTAVQRYGFICKVLNFDDITVAANLKAAGQKWLTDGQYEQMTLTLTAVDLHTLGYDLQPLRINTKVRCVSSSHGMNRYFEVSKRTYHLTQPETDTVAFGQAIKKTYTSSSHSQVQAVKQHAEQLRQNIDSVIEQERDNVTNIINQATHGYVVMDPNSGPERILIMDTNNIQTAQKMWKWDLNGLAYSSTGINGPWSTAAITMNGQISANFITTGELDASVIKVGRIQDANNYNYWDMETGEVKLAATTQVGTSTIASQDDLEDLVVDTDVEYGNSANSNTQPSTWTTNASWEQGKHLWMRVKMTLEDGTVQYSTPRIIANGDGLGVKKVTEQYYLSTSNSSQAGGSWSDTQPTWVNGRYYWTRSKIDWADGSTTYSDPVLATALTSGNQSTKDLDDALDQQSVFNRLTNNGQTQGIYLSNNRVYINASYIATGTLADANNNVKFELSTGTLTMKKGSIDIGNGTFKVTTGGALTATSADIKGTILCGNSNGYYARLNSVGQLEGGYSSTRYGYIDFSAKVRDIDHSTQSNPVYWNGLQVQGEILRITTDVIAVYKGTNTGSTSTNGGTGTITYMNNFHWDSSDEKWHWTNNNLRFINGIMVTSL